MDKETKSFFRVLAVIIAFLWITTSVCKAQENGKVNFNLQGDIVSSYVWRGMYESGASIQSTLGINIGSFSLTAWGSEDFTGQGYKEVDITAAYNVKGLTASIADYWWGGQSGIYNNRKNGNNNYFHLDNHKTDHILEAGLSYTLPIKKMPLSLSWYTMMWGADKKTNDRGEVKNAYSSYAEIVAPFTIKDVNLNAVVGLSPFASPSNYKNNSFTVTNVSFKASKEFKVTDKFSLPVFSQIIWNPNREDVHFVFGITLK
jgi:hypothetical protein